jgi:hypothetical protein
MAAKEVMADHLSEAGVDNAEKAECIDIFILNAKFLGLLRTIAGSERIIPIEQALEEASAVPTGQADRSAGSDGAGADARALRNRTSAVEEPTGNFAKTCFYISPIGEENSEERQHADFMMAFII